MQIKIICSAFFVINKQLIKVFLEVKYNYFMFLKIVKVIRE